MSTGENLLIIYLIISILAILLNLLILLIILFQKDSLQLTYYYLFFIFHASCFSDSLTALPFIYNFSHSWCLANQSFKYYFGLMNLLLITYILQGNRLEIFHLAKSYLTLTNRTLIYCIIFLFPCISFFPYSNHTYHVREADPFCIYVFNENDNNQKNIIWIICSHYLWVILFILINLFYYLVV